MIDKPLFKHLLSLILMTGSVSILGSCASQPTTTTPTTATSPSPAAETAATSADKKDLKQVKFTLSWLFQGVDAPLAIAIDKGYFAENGLEVTFDRGYGSADSINKIASGVYDIGEGDMYSMMEFNAKNPNNKLVAVAIKYNKSPLAIVTLKDRDISSPEQLVGKTLGAPAGDSARRLFPVFASVKGFDANSVTWKSVEPKLREPLLSKGEFDGISAFNISSLPPLNKMGFGPDKLNVFMYADHGLNLYGNALIVRESLLKDNPELIKRFVAAYLKGLQDTIKDQETAMATVLKFNKDGLLDEKLERERLKIAVESLFVTPEVKRNGVGAVDAARLKKTMEQVAQGFKITQVPAPEAIFNPSFLPPKEQRAL